MTTAQTAILKSELTTDPRGYGYSALITAGNASGLADMLNLARTGVAGNVTVSGGATVAMVPTTPTAAGGVAGGLIQVRRNDISGAEILQAVDPSADGATTLTNLQTAYFNAASTMRTLSFVNADGTDNAVLKNLKQCFTNNSASRTALAALSKRTGSRWEELTLAGQSVTDADVSAALNS